MKTKNMLMSSVAVLSILVFVTSAQVRQSDQSRIELLEMGMYGPETTAQTGEVWLGLNISDQGSQILPYRLTVDKLAESPITVDLPLDPLFLLKGASMLSAGPVITIFGGGDETSWRPLLAKPPMELRLAGVVYSLEVTGSGDNSECSGEGLPHNARLVLKSGEKEQTIYSLGWYCGEDSSWFLIWAGDLDRDGHLDLYVSVGSEKRLLLSSPAGKGHFIKDVAQLYTGCGC